MRYGLSLTLFLFCSAAFGQQEINNPPVAATSTVLGTVKPDGTTITNTAGAIAAASTTVNGTTCTPGSSCSPSAAVSSAVVNTTRDLTTASGTQTVSGFGFTPSSCEGFGAVDSSALGTYTTWQGHTDSTLTQAVLWSNATSVRYSVNAFFIAADTTATNFQSALITGYNSGSITLTWTKTGTPTGTFAFSVRCFK